MTARLAVAALALVPGGMLAPAAAAAQSFMLPTSDYFATRLWAEAGLKHTWRGLDLGSAAVGAGGASSWGEPGAGELRFIVHGEAGTAFADRVELSDLLRAGALLRYQLTDDGAYAWLGGDGYAFPAAAAGRTTAELAAGVAFPMPVWLPERRPTVFLEAYRDLHRSRATHLRAMLRLDYRFAPAWGLLIDVGHAWQDRAATAGTDLTLTLLHQPEPGRAGARPPLYVEPYAGIIWVRQNADANIIDLGIRIVRQ